jgi:preprotein translocase subunit SecG
MGIVSVLLLVLFSITSVLLILIVMLQDEQGEGLGGIFGGGSSGQIGNRRGNVLTKTTSVLGVVFILTSFGLAWLNRTPDVGNIEAAARQSAAAEFEEWWNQLPVDGE